MTDGHPAAASPSGSGVDLEPAELHDSGIRLAAAADDARPGLEAATAGDCASGFPGTATGAYSALIARWAEDDRALLRSVDSMSTRLHTVASDYVAADQANAARLSGAGGVGAAGGVAGPLNL